MNDLISRQAAISMIDDLMGGYIPIGTSTFKEGVVDGYARAISGIKILPSAEKRGKWIRIKNAPQEIAQRLHTMRCSFCGEYQTAPYLGTFKVFNFCPNCGAKMERSEDGET